MSASRKNSTSRIPYAALYGPTTGDRIRLGDTALFIEVEQDFIRPGDELLVGEGRNFREGGMASSRIDPDETLDVVFANAVVLDPILGIVKSHVGVKDGRIVGIAGKTASSGLFKIGTNTGIVPCEGLIATAGGIDTHVHLITPRLVEESLSAGITTLIAAGSGGIWDVGTNPRRHMDLIFGAFDAFPINLGLLSRGSARRKGPLLNSLEAGACGFKVHEDVGVGPEIIDTCLEVAVEHDVAVCLHTDSLNETGFVEETIAAIDGRAIHAFHVEGTGGGHVPDALRMVGHENILCSSTNPTLPYSVNTVKEALAMIMTVHRLSPLRPSDMAIAQARIRKGTLAAEGVLHDMGAIPIVNSDAQGMGRIGETVQRTWQLADRMKQLGSSGREAIHKPESDNERALRYLAKYTINPAIVHGISRYVGSLDLGKIADIVLWKPGFFGVKPEIIYKAGFAVWGLRGNGNGSTRICQPLNYGGFFGFLGRAPRTLSLRFVSKAFYEQWIRSGRRSKKDRDLSPCTVPVEGARRARMKDMILNTSCPDIRVEPETAQVTVDGRPVSSPPAKETSLSRLYVLG